MPKRATELPALAVKNIKHSEKSNLPEKYPVGGVAGLMIQVTPHGSKSWLLRTTIAGKRQILELGPYPEVSLKDARERAAAIRRKIRDGVDPVAERKAARSALVAEKLRGVTFREAVEKYLATKLHDKAEKTRRQWASTLESHAVPIIGDLLVDDVDVHDVLRVLEPIWQTKTETASRLRGRIESILTFAIVKGYRRTSDNPARWGGHLKELLPMPGKVTPTVHMSAVNWPEAPAWFALLRERDGMSARALEFLTFTAARSGEVRGAVWPEIDLSACVWTIPAARMKAGREHRVPLSGPAVDILRGLPRFEESDYVFPAVRGGPLSDMALSAVMRRIHADEIEAGRTGFLDRLSARPAVPHGLRSTFRDWAGERTDYPREIVELCLAHDIAGSVERAYRRGDVLAKRAEIMTAWADFIRGRV